MISPIFIEEETGPEIWTDHAQVAQKWLIPFPHPDLSALLCPCPGPASCSTAPGPRAGSSGYLHIISVDDGTGDVGEQAYELLLKATHAVRDLVNDDLDPLVVPQDVDADDSRVIVARQVPGHDVHHKVTGAVGHEEVEGAQDAIHTSCRESPRLVLFL